MAKEQAGKKAPESKSLRFPSIGASLSVQQPVQGNLLQLAYQSSQAGEVELRLLDSSGRFLAQWQLDSRPGQNNEGLKPRLRVGAVVVRSYFIY